MLPNCACVVPTGTPTPIMLHDTVLSEVQPTIVAFSASVLPVVSVSVFCEIVTASGTVLGNVTGGGDVLL